MAKNVLITGVSRKPGIGAALAFRLASAGYNVYTSYYRSYDQTLPEWEKNDDEIEQITRQLSNYDIQHASGEWNLSDVTAISQMFEHAEQTLGPIYALINNACFSVDTTIDDLTPELLDQHYFLNLRAPMLLAQRFVQGFRRQDLYCEGRIISLTSGYGNEPNPGNLAYSATKAAMNRFTNSLALEVAPLGITVNSVDPGPTDTGWMPMKLKQDLLAQAPMKRLGMPDDVANLVEFLASEKSQWITGQILHSRGGF